MRKWRWWIVGGLGVTGVVAAVCLWQWFQAGDWLHSRLGLDFDDAVSAAVAGGDEVRLRDLTEFDWQTVSIFHEGAIGESVFEETGVDVVRTSVFDYSRVLMVFCSDDAVVDVHGYAYPNLTFEQNTYSADVVVDGGRLVEPSGLEVRAACSP